MSDHQGVAVFHVGRNVRIPDRGLKVILREDDHHIARLGRFGRFHHLEAVVFDLLPARGGFPQTHDDVRAAVLCVQRMGAPLASVADDGDFPVLQQIQVRIGVIVNFQVFQQLFFICFAHGLWPSRIRSPRRAIKKRFTWVENIRHAKTNRLLVGNRRKRDHNLGAGSGSVKALRAPGRKFGKRAIPLLASAPQNAT